MAELLERATRERRASVDDGLGADTGPGHGLDGAVPGPGDDGSVASPEEPVTGGVWLPAETPSGARHRAGRAGPGFLTWPESLRSVRLTVRPAAVVGVLLVVLVAGAVFGVRWWMAERASRPVPLASQQVESLSSGGDSESTTAPAGSARAGPTPAGPATGLTPGDASAGGGGADDGTQPAPTGAPARVLVHVAGEVGDPGVVTLEAGARVQDAVREAGGLTADADTSRVNLARPVADGERIWVPRPGEMVPELVDGQTGPGVGGAGPAAGGVGGAADAQVNLNTADQAALEELPGVGPVTAAAILQWRTDHGRFTSTDELLEVSGIGEATLEKLLPHVTL